MYGNGQEIQEIKARLNLVDIVQRYVNLRHSGGSRWMGTCPFHQETKPSFSVDADQGFYHCFGCHAHGDLFDFYQQINGLTFSEALEQLAEEAGVQLVRRNNNDDRNTPALKRKELLKIHELAVSYFNTNLAAREGLECRNYIEQRGLSEDIVKMFGLGWARREWQGLSDTLHRAGFSDELGIQSALLGQNKNGRPYDRFRGRLMFPIRSLSNKVIAFGGRIISDADKEEAKYINSSDTQIYKKGEHLYGLSQARQAISVGQPILLTEGYMDVLTLHQYGYRSAVGVLGTALTPNQIKRIMGFTSHVELLFDGDNAGHKAALRSCEMLLTLGLSCKVITFPEGEDIDSLLRKAKGKDFFEDLRQHAPKGIVFCANALNNMALRDAVDWTRKFLTQVSIPEIAGHYASFLAQSLGLSERELRDRVVADRSSHKERVEIKVALPEENINEREILKFLVRYPNDQENLRDIGAHFLLVSPRAKSLWQKIEEIPEKEHISPENVVQYLSGWEKDFWISSRTGESAPLDNEEGEFQAIIALVNAMKITTQSTSVSAALNQSSSSINSSAGRDYLRSLQAVIEGIYGQY